MFLEFLAAENLKNTIPAPLCRGMGHRVPPIPSGNRVFGVYSCRKPQNTIPAPLCLCRGMGSRQFRAGIVFLEFLAAENLKNTIPARDGASGPANSERESCFLEFLAAENLKNTIPAPLCRGMGHRVPPIPSQNRVFGVFSSNSERESCFWSF